MAWRYFFYGTLMDAAVRRRVLGREVAGRHIRPATLAGWRRVHRRGAGYPVLVADPDARVEGLLVAPLDAADAARLARFEGPDYRLAALPVTPLPETPLPESVPTVVARVFLPLSPALATRRPWHFAAWSARQRAAFLARLGDAGMARP